MSRFLEACAAFVRAQGFDAIRIAEARGWLTVEENRVSVGPQS